MVTTRELNNLRTPSIAACKSNGRHGRLGTAIGHAHFLNCRDTREDELGHFDFERIGCTETRTAFECTCDGRTNRGFIVTVNRWTPGQNKVDQLLPIGGGQARTVGLDRKERRTPNRTECPHGRINPTRNHLLGAGK